MPAAPLPFGMRLVEGISRRLTSGAFANSPKHVARRVLVSTHRLRQTAASSFDGFQGSTEERSGEMKPRASPLAWPESFQRDPRNDKNSLFNPVPYSVKFFFTFCQKIDSKEKNFNWLNTVTYRTHTEPELLLHGSCLCSLRITFLWNDCRFSLANRILAAKNRPSSTYGDLICREVQQKKIIWKLFGIKTILNHFSFHWASSRY